MPITEMFVVDEIDIYVFLSILKFAFSKFIFIFNS